jgi:hypothetical protein
VERDLRVRVLEQHRDADRRKTRSESAFHLPGFSETSYFLFGFAVGERIVTMTIVGSPRYKTGDQKLKRVRRLLRR